MSANFSNLPPETQELLAQRYGLKRRNGWKIPAAILLVIGLPWLMWSAWHHSNPEFRVTLISFQNEKSDSIEITYVVERRDPSRELTCTLVARDIDKNVVGEIEDKVPASTFSSITISRTIPARIEPVNAAVLGCRAA
jgi:Domain of unknown function (DUF4307)